MWDTRNTFYRRYGLQLEQPYDYVSDYWTLTNKLCPPPYRGGWVSDFFDKIKPSISMIFGKGKF